MPADNLHKDTLFIVDEASMIANEGLDSFVFGSGRLLNDLIQYVYSGENCRLILMGDVAQLPPVMQTESPALNPEILRGYNLQVWEIALTQSYAKARTRESCSTQPGYETHYETTRSRSFRNYN